jgi:hypothetical protein
LVRRTTMPKQVSEQLADLSARAKEAEQGVAAAKDRGSSMVQQREDQIKANADRRRQSMSQQASEARDSVAAQWSGLTNKVQSDIDGLRARVDYKMYEHDRERAAKAADDAEVSAERAIYFALDAIDYAETAVLDAALARETAASF